MWMLMFSIVYFVSNGSMWVQKFYYILLNFASGAPFFRLPCRISVTVSNVFQHFDYLPSSSSSFSRRNEPISNVLRSKTD